jgi:cytochrome c553
VLLCGGQAAAQGAPSGALSCSGCHGPAGGGGPVPSLAGQPAQEIVAALMQFRAGERAATVMDRIAKGFTDDEIRAIAEWFAGGGGQAARNSQP